MTCSDLQCGCACHQRRDARCSTDKCGAWTTNQPVARAAIVAAGIIDRLRDDLSRSQESFARLYDDTRCPEDNCDGQVGHAGKHYCWVAD